MSTAQRASVLVNSATGLPLLAQLTLATPVINGFGGANDNVSITAGKVFLQGTGTTLPSSGTGTGQGQFTIDATEVVLGGGGIMTFNGFSNVTLAATGDVTSSKVGRDLVFRTNGRRNNLL